MPRYSISHSYSQCYEIKYNCFLLKMIVMCCDVKICGIAHASYNILSYNILCIKPRWSPFLIKKIKKLNICEKNMCDILVKKQLYTLLLIMGYWLTT